MVIHSKVSVGARDLRSEQLLQLARLGRLLSVVVAAEVLPADENVRNSALLREAKQRILDRWALLELIKLDARVSDAERVEQRLRQRQARGQAWRGSTTTLCKGSAR